MADPAPKMTPGEAKARKRHKQLFGRVLPKTLHCSFCGKSQHKVKMLVAGPAVFICDACIGLCQQIISGGPYPDAGFSPLERPTEDLLEVLPSLNFATDANRNMLQAVVDTLREREVSWAAIAEKLGVSRQAAWERFS
jgi:hypothetical protein